MTHLIYLSIRFAKLIGKWIRIEEQRLRPHESELRLRPLSEILLQPQSLLTPIKASDWFREITWQAIRGWVAERGYSLNSDSFWRGKRLWPQFLLTPPIRLAPRNHMTSHKRQRPPSMWKEAEMSQNFWGSTDGQHTQLIKTAEKKKW